MTPHQARSNALDNRRLAVVALLAALLTGCSITSTPANVDHLRCVKAHDEWHESGGTVTVCDEYSPEPEATR